MRWGSYHAWLNWIFWSTWAADHDPFGPEEIFLAHLPAGMRIQVWTNVHGHPWCLS